MSELSEPRTYEALTAVVTRRNRANSTASRIRLPVVDATRALAVLEAVRDGAQPDLEPRGLRDFLGGVGLIVRRGWRDTITDAGLDLLRSARRSP